MLKIIIFFEILSGIFIFRRILGEIRMNCLLRETQMTKIVAAFFILNLCISILPTRSLSLFTLIWALLASAFAILPFLIRQSRRRELREQLLFVVTSVLLHVRLGLAFRTAIVKTGDYIGGYAGAKIRNLNDLLVTKAPIDQVDAVFAEFYSVLVECESEPHLSSERLSRFRQKLIVKENFRKKKAQALHQLRAQAAILTLIFIAVFAFVIFRFGYQEQSRLLILSASLFSFGLLVTLSIGRKVRWTT